MMRESVMPSIMWLVCLATLFLLAHAKPSGQVDSKDVDSQKLQQAQDDMNWESQWWTPQDKDTKGKNTPVKDTPVKDTPVKDTPVKASKNDGWKAFKSEKPAERRRWWEEDWHEDEWWGSKDSSNSISNSKTASPSDKTAKKTAVPSGGKGEDPAELVKRVDNPPTPILPPEDTRQQYGQEQPRALPLMAASDQVEQDSSHSKLQQDNYPDKLEQDSSPSELKQDSSLGKLEQDSSGFILKDNRAPQFQADAPDTKVNVPVADKMDLPAVESPRERLNPGLKGDIMISPFEDPKPGPYSSGRDEAPSIKQWEYHQLTGFGKYIDQGKHKENMRDALSSQEDSKELSQDRAAEDDGQMNEEEYLKEKAEHMQEEIEEKEKDRSLSEPEENKYKVVDQFYGFGLESGPKVSSTLAPPSNSVKANATLSSAEKSEVEKENKENYNKGIIYDMIPGFPQLTHSVKKDLLHSGNRDLVQSVKEDQPVREDQSLEEKKPLEDYPMSDQAVEDSPAVKEDEGHSVDENRAVKEDKASVLLTLGAHSVKKDLSQEHFQEHSLKPSLPTSPNPPPPGLADSQGADTTPVAPRKTSPSQPAQLFIKSHPLTFCKLDAECRKGRQCQGGLCVCLPSDGCQGHHKPVCGSDGKQYPSFCELHRTACVRHIHIKVDYTAKCFMKHASEMQKIEEENYKDHLAPTPSSHASNDEDNDDSDSDYDENDYDEEDYYDGEDEKVKEDDADEVDEWLKKNTKVTLDSNKIYDYSKDLKKGGKKSGDGAVDPTPWDHVQEEMGQEFEGAGSKAGLGGSMDYQSDGGYKECSKEELTKFKRQLLEFHCKRFQEPDCQLEVKEERDYLTNLMFSYLDMNTDYQLSYEELKSRQKSEKFSDINKVCELTDLIWYDDTANADGSLSLDEFEHAFNSVNQPSEPSQGAADSGVSVVRSSVHVIPTLATVGNGLELKCGLAGSGSSVLWRRHGVNLRDLANVTAELMVLDDGSLFFSRMGVHHMGNYSCQDPSHPSTLQVHALKVQMPPIVRVSPHSQIDLPKLNAKMKCHAEGVPKPTISWHKNNVPISRETHHYALEDHNELLLVYNTESQRDSGAYKCVARNQAGTSEDVASVVVMKDDKSWGLNSKADSGMFVLFHKEGYTVYSPDDCLRSRAVHKDFGFFKFIPDSLDSPLRLCLQDRDCQWGQAVNVKNSFIYASQPDLNRVVVIETTKNWIPMQVVSTDKRPVQLHYVEHLDQVWVLCWNSEEDDSAKTMVVIRDASKVLQHRSVHTQPVGNHFDQVQALFMAPPNNLRHVFDFGYVTHAGQQGLTKLDLDNMRYVRSVDLSPYGCLPQALAFVPIGGHVVVQCVSPLTHQPLQLVLDYITDAVLSSSILSGRPYISPDSRHVITVDDLTGKVNVAGVTNEGVVEAAYEVTVSASISDVAFYPAFGEGYLLVLTSADDDDIITINLSTGKVAKQKGTNGFLGSVDWHPSPVKRTITTADVFSNFLMAPSKSALAVIDMKFHSVICENTDIPRSQATIFIGH